MGTLTEEIFARRIGRPVQAGEIVIAPVDYVMSHDNTTPLAIESFRKLERPLWDPERVIIAFDHMVPAPTVAAAELHRRIRAFIAEQGITTRLHRGHLPSGDGGARLCDAGRPGGRRRFA